MAAVAFLIIVTVRNVLRRHVFDTQSQLSSLTSNGIS